MGPLKRLYPVAFSGGIDTKTDPKQVIPGKLLDLQNGIFGQTGMVNRRWGYTALGTGIIGSALAIAKCAAVEGSFNNELLMYDGQNAYSYIAANNAWASRGEVVSVIQTNQQIVRNSAQQLSPDSATLNGIQVYAWEDSRGGIRYSIVDQLSGAFILVDRPLYAGMPSVLFRPKCIPLPSVSSIAVFFVTADGTWSYVAINTSNPTAPTSPVVILSSQGASGVGFGLFFDVSPVTNTLGGPSTYYAIAQRNFGAGWQYTGGTLTFNASGNLIFTFTLFGTGPLPNGVSPSIYSEATTNSVSSFYPDTTTTVTAQVQTLSGLLTITPNPVVTLPGGFTVAAITSVRVGQTIWLFVEGAGASGHIIVVNTITVSGTTGTLGTPSGTVFVRGCGLASKAFTFGGNIYVNVATQSQQQSTYFTLDQTGNVVAKAVGQLGGGYIASSDYVLPECQQLSSGIFQYTNLVKGIVNTEAGGVLSLLGVNKTKLDFFDSNSYLSSNLAGELYVVGGILQRYDGAIYSEVGFHMYPEAPVVTPVLSGGAMADGIYDYAITYEWIDNTGAVEISTPSIVQTVTIAGGGGAGSVQLTVPTLRLTKKPNVRIVVYRTVGAGGSTGSILYRVTSAVVPLYNNAAADTVAFTDTLADASITSNGAMYTQPLTVGQNPILPNAAPPACAFITTFANRIFISGGDLANSIWYSQAAIAGSPAQFSGFLQLSIDPDGGPITGLARMDDKLIIFKQTGIFYITGQGPTATGDQNDFGVPIQIPTGDVGCSTNNSVVLTPMGLLFQSLNGIYLLDRGLNVTYKGAPVEQYTLPTAQNLTITSATLVPNQWVIFTTSSTSGIALVYDYFYDQWSTFTNHQAFDSDLWLGGGNKFVWANAATGVVYLQTPGAFSDAGAPIKFSLTTSWLTFAGIQGYQRVYHALLLGQYKGAHTLNVACGFDYADPFEAMAAVPVDATLGTSLFGASTPFGAGTPFGDVTPGASVYQFRFDLLRKCQAVRFQITDVESSPGNEGFSLSSLGLVVGVKSGANKVSQIKQFGAS